MKQKHFLISLAVLATGISVGAQTKDNEIGRAHV